MMRATGLEKGSLQVRARCAVGTSGGFWYERTRLREPYTSNSADATLLRRTSQSAHSTVHTMEKVPVGEISSVMLQYLVTTHGRIIYILCTHHFFNTKSLLLLNPQAQRCKKEFS